MELSRRIVLAGLTASAAVAALPIAAVAEAAPVAAIAKPPGWWGYSRDGEFWHGYFDSREEAIAQALADSEGEPFTTSRCISYELCVPDLAEHMIEWLPDHFRPSSLEFRLADWFAGSNEDADWEGDLIDEFHRANYQPLAAMLIDLLSTAFFRAGRPDLIGVLFTERHDLPICDDDAFFEVLGADAQFAAEAEAAGEAWLASQAAIHNAPRALTPYDEEDHPGEEDLSA